MEMRRGRGARLAVLVVSFAMCLPVLGAVAAAAGAAFTEVGRASVGRSPRDLAVADFNQDGRKDAITADSLGDTLTTLLGTGAHRFAPPRSWSSYGHPVAVGTGDFDADGHADVAVVAQRGWVDVWRGKGDGTLARWAIQGINGTPSDLAVADFNRDGFSDVAVVTSDWSQLLVYQGGSRGLTSPRIYTAAQGNAGLYWPQSLVAADFTGDGNVDLAVAESGDNLVRVLANRGDGSFVTPSLTLPLGAGWNIAAADVNLDGRPDLLKLDGSTRVSIALNQGGGRFSGASFVSLSGPATAVGVADFNADRKPDLAVSDTTNTVSVLGNAGDGRFVSTLARASVGNRPTALVAGDFGDDEQFDILTANFNDSTVSVLKNAALPAPEASPSSVDFGGIQLGGPGADRTVTLRNGGGNAYLRLGAATVSAGGSSPHPEDFQIRRDDCAGKVLAGGETCTVVVHASPGAIGIRTGSLKAPNNSSIADPLAVALSATVQSGQVTGPGTGGGSGTGGSGSGGGGTSGSGTGGTGSGHGITNIGIGGAGGSAGSGGQGTGSGLGGQSGMPCWTCTASGGIVRARILTRRARVGRGRRVTVRVRCLAGTCQGVLGLVRGRRLIGTRSARIGRGRTVRVRIRINVKAYRRLRARHRIRVRAVYATSLRRLATVPVTLRR